MPGAWVQMIEFYHMCQSDNGSITDSNAIRQWSQKYMQSLDSIKDPRAGLRLQNLLNEAGFVQVELEMIRVPLCGWSTGMNLCLHMISASFAGQINVILTASADFLYLRSSQAKTYRRDRSEACQRDYEEPCYTPVDEDAKHAYQGSG